MKKLSFTKLTYERPATKLVRVQAEASILDGSMTDEQVTLSRGAKTVTAIGFEDGGSFDVEF